MYTCIDNFFYNVTDFLIRFRIIIVDIDEDEKKDVENNLKS